MNNDLNRLAEIFASGGSPRGVGFAHDIREFIAAYEKLNEGIEKVLRYCEPHVHKMWAAKVVGALLGCEFRDAPEELKKALPAKDENIIHGQIGETIAKALGGRVVVSGAKCRECHTPLILEGTSMVSAFGKDRTDDWKRIQDAERALDSATEEIACLRSVLSEWEQDKSCYLQMNRADELAALRAK